MQTMSFLQVNQICNSISFPSCPGPHRSSIPFWIYQEVSNLLLLTSDSLGILVLSLVLSVGGVVLVRTVVLVVAIALVLAVLGAGSNLRVVVIMGNLVQTVIVVGGGGCLALLVCVPLTIGISPAVLVVLVVRVPLSVGISPAILALLVVIFSIARLDSAIIGVPLAVRVGPTVLSILAILAILDVLVVGMPLTVGISPTILVVLLAVLIVLAVLVVVVAPLATLLNLAVLVVAVIAVVGNEHAILPLTLSVLSTRVPLTGHVVGVHGAREDAERRDSQKQECVDDGAAHLEGR